MKMGEEKEKKRGEATNEAKVILHSSLVSDAVRLGPTGNIVRYGLPRQRSFSQDVDVI